MAFVKRLVAEDHLVPCVSLVAIVLLGAVAGGDKSVESAKGESRTPLAIVFHLLFSNEEPVTNFAERATKERAGDTVKVNVAEFAEADPGRPTLHQKAVALPKREDISCEAAVTRYL